MDTTVYTWKVNALESYPNYDQYENVVFNIHWSCFGSREVSGSVSGSFDTYTANNIGVTGVTFQSGSNFVPYNELTEEIIVGWLHYQLGDEMTGSIETNVSQAIDNKINPPIVKLPLPWNSVDI